MNTTEPTDVIAFEHVLEARCHTCDWATVPQPPQDMDVRFLAREHAEETGHTVQATDSYTVSYGPAAS